MSGANIKDQLKDCDRAINTLHTMHIIHNMLMRSGAKLDVEQIVLTMPWINFFKGKDMRFYEHDGPNQALQMISYSSKVGRQVLESVYDGIVYHRRGENDLAAKAYLCVPDGLYPDIDPRNGLKDINSLTKDLIRANMAGLAVQLAGLVDGSLIGNDCSKSSFFLGDVWRMVARSQGGKRHEVLLFSIPETLRAIDAYSKKPPGKLRGQKIGKASRELNHLNSMLQLTHKT